MLLRHLRSVVLPIVVGGCTPYGDLRPVTPAAPRQLPQWEELRGVSVGVKPSASAEENEKAFGITLLDQGIFPVVLSIENQSSSTLVFEKDKVFLFATEKREGGDLLGSQGIVVDSATGQVLEGGVELALAGGIAVFISGILETGTLLNFWSVTLPSGVTAFGLGAAAAGLPLIFAYANTESRATQIRHNLIAAEIPDGTLAPGASVSGLVYLLTRRSGAAQQDHRLVLRVDLPTLHASSTWRFAFLMPLALQLQK